MAKPEVKKEQRGGKNSGQKKNTVSLKQETRHTMLAVVMFILALLFIFAMWGGAGPAGAFLYSTFSALLGFGYVLVPVLFLLLGASFTRPKRPEIARTHTIGSILFFISSLGLIEIATSETHRAGMLGQAIAYPFLKLFGVYASIILLGGILIISLLVLFDARPDFSKFTDTIRAFFAQLFTRRPRTEKEVTAPDETPVETEGSVPEPETMSTDTSPEDTEPIAENEEALFDKKSKDRGRHYSAYIPPPLSLLEKDRGKPGVGDIKANANIIKRTLQNFGIDVEMDEITIGPTVTRYALKPAEGVRLSKISSLQDNLALALAAQSIRVEAPIPGKSLVGIEVPNSSKTTVGLGSLLGSKEYTDSPKPLLVSIGKNVGGIPIFYDLAKMPHLLIAGTTGSGKSVTVHAILNSLLYRNSPDLLKFIMVDAKRVELTLYNKIPHLLTPVITEAKKTILALKWAAKEMDRRYDVLERHSVRDISSYHKNIFGPAIAKDKNAEDLPEAMPYIVIVIDELADLMQAYPRELESAIVRLAQMSRAVGIHLILSTQRPSVNVITGLIKANIPTRIALKVGSQIDSRTIIDKAGAEKLVGQGDMLFSTQDAPEPSRIQSPYISEEEVKKVVAFLVSNAKEDIVNEINLTGGSVSADKSIFEASLEGDGEEDDLYEDARQTVIEAGKASTSFLQRKLGVGYARAAKLIDMLEERGIVGAGNGAKPREVLEKSAAAERAEFPTE